MSAVDGGDSNSFSAEKDLEVTVVLVSEPLGMGVRAEDVGLLQRLKVHCRKSTSEQQDPRCFSCP